MSGLTGYPEVERGVEYARGLVVRQQTEGALSPPLKRMAAVGKRSIRVEQSDSDPRAVQVQLERYAADEDLVEDSLLR
jgi:hypothetical protein